jgi:hypothetical protein
LLMCAEARSNSATTITTARQNASQCDLVKLRDVRMKNYECGRDGAPQHLD